jgi:desulfoferrodoxin (superoxide reductase-like protein)
MKIFLLSLLIVLAYCTCGFCHSPSDIEVTVKKEGIDLAVSHSVSNPASHYVKKIEVKLNGETAAQKDFKSQTDDMAQKTSIDIASLKKGDVLEITAYCSRSGERTKSVTVD